MTETFTSTLETFTPPVDEFSGFVLGLSANLGDVPEVWPVIDSAFVDPNDARHIYGSYIELINEMAGLDEHQKAMIKAAKLKMEADGGDVGSASNLSAAELLAEIGDPSVLNGIARGSMNPHSSIYSTAIGDLAKRMKTGHDLHQSGRALSDGDPESDTAIWGQTQISDVHALTHLTLAHYLERCFAAGLKDSVEAAAHKDFFLNSLADVLIVDHLGANRFEPMFRLWAAPKDQGGLGWITEARLRSYAVE